MLLLQVTHTHTHTHTHTDAHTCTHTYTHTHTDLLAQPRFHFESFWTWFDLHFLPGRKQCEPIGLLEMKQNSRIVMRCGPKKHGPVLDCLGPLAIEFSARQCERNGRLEVKQNTVPVVINDPTMVLCRAVSVHF
jgi:hypothetical protein